MKRYDIENYTAIEIYNGDWVKYEEVKPLLDHIIELKEENKTLNRLFKLQHKRSLEADKLWQKATGKTHVLPDLGVLLKWLMDQIEKLEWKIRRAYAMLSVYGVPEERAGSISNGIDVLATRYKKEIRMNNGENSELKAKNKLILDMLKDISAELKLSNDQGDLAIDGRHMNILAVWDEIDKLIEQEKNNG